MAEIIDFEARRSAHLRDNAGKCAEKARGLLARLEWLKRNGATLADVVRASLDSRKAQHDCREIARGLGAAAAENLPA